MKRLIEKGQWTDNVSWKLYASDELPDEKLISVVCCVAIHDEKIVLMRAERGWGMLGGHIEQGETILEALAREALEEGGFMPYNPLLCGYREVSARQALPYPGNGRMYPFPTSYIVYYWATTKTAIVSPSGVEVLESKSFTFDEIRAAGLSDASTIELGWNAYLKAK